MKKNILNMLFSRIDNNNVYSVIHYGNRNESDIDLCIIINAPVQYQKTSIAELDITIFSHDYFDYLISMWNPLVTEPVLNGEVIYGASIDNYRRMILSREPNQKIIEHLHDFAQQISRAAMNLRKEKKYHDSLINIMFTLSFLAYANYYKDSKRPILFKDLLLINRASLLNKVYASVKSKNFQAVRTKNFALKTELLLNYI